MPQQADIALELCGRLADAGGPVLHLAIPSAGLSAGDLLAQAAAALGLEDEAAKGRIRICINEHVAGADSWVKPGDTAALFPPVSGG